ncbi:MAG: DUF4198 domain-containing protein [Paracoccaceae bacterium]
MRLLFICLLAFHAVCKPAAAHEFWIDPEKYQVETGAPLVANIRNGQTFKGVGLGYFERSIARFDLIGPDGMEPMQGRMGDVPAMATTAGADGLWVIVHETTPSLLTYTTWEKFQAFADHKDFPDMRARHDARGLPETGFKESYTRFAKALVAVGDGAGADAATGMETEFVALTNPYTDPGDSFAARVLYQGMPRADSQVEAFDRAPDGTVTVTLLRTDAKGEVQVPVTSGHTYLLDAVVLRPVKFDNGAVWESLWAALTFAVK